VTGAKTREDSFAAARRYATIIQRAGFPDAHFHESKYRVQNMTATCDVGFPIRLEGFLYAHSANSTYEPELFPGLIFRMTDPKVVLLIFVSGKIIVTGAKVETDVHAAIDNIYGQLEEFRKRNIIVRPRQET
jgi:transcription initiation factor TFIID TATA-box-binding protein